MNLSNLEKLAREAMKGNSLTGMSEDMLKRGVLSPIEHRSVQSLSWQIAASARPQSVSNIAASVRSPYRVWI
ncbi:MAG TPA: hypothetical protein VEY08_11810 [Chloroflexia bacterium]|nr:hypothetical protein [Chloroflexia bacterium]